MTRKTAKGEAKIKNEPLENSTKQLMKRTPGVGDGQGGLACCNSWGHKELDTTKRLN